MKLTRGRTVGLIAVLVLLFLLADAFIAPASAHEVHTAGAVAVSAAGYTSTQKVYWQPGPPSESLADMNCNWTYLVASPCTAAGAAADFPGLHQSPQTLYYVWTGCIDWRGHGPVIDYSGFNAEYLAAGRTLVVHCYAATGWINFPNDVMGMATVTWVLLAIPTAGMGAGKLRIQEDDRLQHLVGESSNQYDLVTATIS